MATNDAAHWDDLYRTRPVDGVGWYEPAPTTLPDVLAMLGEAPGTMVDVGAGASVLADALWDAGHRELLLVDVSDAALEHTRRRFIADGRPAPETLVADATTLDLGRRAAVWHDRAVFHFLVDDADRAAYRQALDRSLAVDGRIVMAVFAADGPESCAGLPVARYDAAQLEAEFAPTFESLGCRRHAPSPTGAGDTRPYTICRFRRRARTEPSPT